MRDFLVLAGCVAVLVTFLAHLPACSSQYLPKHQPVTALRALDPGNPLETAVLLPALLALAHVVAPAMSLAPRLGEEPAASFEESFYRALTCSYRC